MVDKLHIFEKVYYDQLLDFPILLLLFLHTLLLTLWMLDFFNTIRVSNSLYPDQARHFVAPDLGQNCLQRFQQTTKVAASGKLDKNNLLILLSSLTLG